MFASNEAHLAYLYPILLICAPLMIGCLVAALIKGMSRDPSKRRNSGKLLIVGAVAALVLFASPWLVELIHRNFHQ